MRKSVVMVSVVAVSLMFSFAAFANEPVKAADPAAVKTEGSAGKGCQFDKGMMKGNFMPGMMMEHMMAKQMVATSDGGVIILIGHKIIKYDKNLNLVKEAEIKMDMEEMKEGMMEKKGHHHMGKCNKGDKEEAKDVSAAPSGNQTAAQ
jgi:hypothetical protein